ncbi:MAG: hypothetical protein ABGY96_23765 [bacterium]|nr:hypothetical protein [Gammaproteobacteria bacterium]
MDSRPTDFTQSTRDKIRVFLDRSDDQIFTQDHAYGVVYTAALASNAASAEKIATDLQIPLTSRVRVNAEKALRFASIEVRPGDDLYTGAAKENQDNDITYFLVCALAASFVKNFESYEILRKLFFWLNLRETVFYDVTYLTSMIQTLAYLSLMDDDKTP